MYRWAPECQGQQNNVFVVRLRGTVDATRLSDALLALVGRHEMLRARFTDEYGEPHQRTDFPAQVPFQQTDASAWDEADLHAAVCKETLRPFDLRARPPLRAHLFQRNGGQSVFALSIDHLASDGWSYWRLLAELGEVLGGKKLGDIDATYRDYIRSQQTWMASLEAARQRDYWLERLSGDLPVLRLSFAERAHGTPGPQGFVRLDLPAERVHALRALAARNAGSLFTCLLGAFQITLQRHTAQDDLVVGCPMPARGTGEWDGVVGDFVNMVALRTQVSGDDELGAVLRRCRNDALRGMVNQDYPFASLVEGLRVSRAAGHPVFQVMFAFQKAREDGGLHRLWAGENGAESGLRWGELSLAPYPTQHQIGLDGIALCLQVLEVGDVLRCDFGFDQGLLEGEAIERFASAFDGTLKAMSRCEVTTRIDSLPIMAQADRQRLLHGFNDTTLPRPAGRLLHQDFEDQVRYNGEAIAVECDGATLSYAALNVRANRVAHRLIALGMRPDDRVALCLERGLDMVVALLGVLKAGGAYVPLDPAYPRERLAYMLADSTPRCVLAQSSLRDVLPAGDAPVLWLDEADLTALPDHDPDPAALGLAAHCLAYIIYTSGSTGRPKGVMIGHDNAVNFIAWSLDEFTPQVLARTVFSTSINFDLHLFELFAPLAAGTTVVLVKDLVSAGLVLDTATLVNTVPSAIAAVLDTGATLRNVRQVNLAGEPLKAALVERLFAQTAIDVVANLYGPSETTTYSTWVSMPRSTGFVPHIGRPVANTKIYIVDRHHQPVPLGVAGEVLIGGDGVARGYLHCADLTAERFIDHPYDNNGGKVYRTGDMARWRADGTIHYLGRNDFQVKLRGFRIELGEIETALSRCEGVREAVVLAREDMPGDKRLVAYVVAHKDTAPTAQGLRESLSRSLAEYMIPSGFVLLPALPLTPNGKLDRSALPAPGLEALATRDYEAPQGEMEQALAAIWGELLGVDCIGRNDHFFELGGNSLLLIKVGFRLKEHFGADLKIGTLYKAATLKEVASAVEAACHRGQCEAQSTVTLEI